MIGKVEYLIDRLTKINEEIKSLEEDAEEVRQYYKYQSTELDQSSESFIVEFSNLELSGLLRSLREIQELEEDQ